MHIFDGIAEVDGVSGAVPQLFFNRDDDALPFYFQFGQFVEGGRDEQLVGDIAGLHIFIESENDVFRIEADGFIRRIFFQHFGCLGIFFPSRRIADVGTGNEQAAGNWQEAKKKIFR